MEEGGGGLSGLGGNFHRYCGQSPERDDIGAFISHAFELTASDLAVYYPIDDLIGPCSPAVQGAFPRGRSCKRPIGKPGPL